MKWITLWVITKQNEYNHRKLGNELLTNLYPILCVGELVKPWVRFETNKLIELDQE